MPNHCFQGNIKAIHVYGVDESQAVLQRIEQEGEEPEIPHFIVIQFINLMDEIYFNMPTFQPFLIPENTFYIKHTIFVTVPLRPYM